MRFLVLATVILLMSLLAAAAQAPQPSVSQPQTQETQNHPYVPGLGNIMETIQFRHFKLSFAGHAANWKLTNYELSQITKSFDEAAKYYPQFANVSLDKLIAEISEPALRQVGDAVKTEDSAAFSRAFRKLTDACNSCHEATGLGFIAIRVPTSSPFSNESFSPSR